MTTPKQLTIALLIATADPGGVDADVLEVPSEAYPTIQSAIVAADHGDTVLVAPGEYLEQIDLLGKPIVVTGVAGFESTVISGEFMLDGAMITFASGEGPDTIVSGFTITGSSGSVLIDGASPTLASCRIAWNGGVDGGGIACHGGAPLIVSCELVGNHAIGRGAGVYADGGRPMLVDCLIADNTASIAGGGVYSEGGGLEMHGCLVSGNAAGTGGGAWCAGPASLDLTETVFVGNVADTSGGGLSVLNATLSIADCEFSTNSAGSGSGLSEGGCTGSIVRCRIVNNLAAAGAFRCGMATEDVSVVNCVISSNAGSGIYNFRSTELINCLVTDNTQSGIATYNNPGDVSIFTNCTVADNLRGITTSSDASPNGTALVTNCVVWGNTLDQISNANGADADTVTYSIVEGGAFGEGNLDADPLFVDPGAVDYRPAAGSPAIDTGDDAAVPPDQFDIDGDGDVEEPTPDLDGRDRVVDGDDNGFVTVDIGAYERASPACPDVDGDLDVGVSDLIEVLLSWGPCECSADVDGDGVAGVLDLVAVVTAWGPCP